MEAAFTSYPSWPRDPTKAYFANYRLKKKKIKHSKNLGLAIASLREMDSGIFLDRCTWNPITDSVRVQCVHVVKERKRGRG